jgi:hypothetical protein
LTEIPIATMHKGVGVHANQRAKRVRLVKSQIDQVTELSDPTSLFQVAADPAWAPEARLCSAARCVAALQLATERRQGRPDIDPAAVQAVTAGLSSIEWQHPTKYCSLLDARGGHERAAPRVPALPWSDPPYARTGAR